MRGRGMQFIKVPDSYYEDLKARLAKSKVTVKEDIDTVCLLADQFWVEISTQNCWG